VANLKEPAKIFENGTRMALNRSSGSILCLKVNKQTLTFVFAVEVVQRCQARFFYPHKAATIIVGNHIAQCSISTVDPQSVLWPLRVSPGEQCSFINRIIELVELHAISFASDFCTVIDVV
jgi:hypothetical protein